MSAGGSGERRAFYRLRYPDAERPVLQFDNRTYPIVELSESGARILTHGEVLAAERPVVGWVWFYDGDAVRVEGSVHRMDGDEAVLKLTQGVNLQRMLAEQRRLIQRFPTLFDPPVEEGDPLPWD